MSVQIGKGVGRVSVRYLVCAHDSIIAMEILRLISRFVFPFTKQIPAEGLHTNEIDSADTCIVDHSSFSHRMNFKKDMKGLL